MAIIADPNTGLFVDNVTGAVYADPGGRAQATDPGLKAQAQRNLSLANAMFARMGGDQQRYQSVFRDQGELTRALDATIRGTAPSVVGTQLQAGLEAGTHAIESAASGASGASVPLAKYAAIQAIGKQQAETNQAAAVARAQEVSDAQKVKAGVMGQMAGEANQSAGINASAGASLSGTAAGSGAEQAKIDEAEKQRWQNFAANLINAGGNVATAYAAGA